MFDFKNILEYYCLFPGLSTQTKAPIFLCFKKQTKKRNSETLRKQQG